ncbi:MAG: xanthine dehydrogenase family protein molybdopterin-binding subunit [Candidatus Dormiibacterota bacterium]
MAVNAGQGGTVRRREDPRLVTGAGRFTDDVHPPGCLHAVFVRSTMAHARITRLDVAEAIAAPGVVGVFGLDDLDLEASTARPPLATEVVRFVGEAMAVVVAETGALAADAAATVFVDYTALPVVIDSSAALEPGATLVHPEIGDNVAFEFELGEPGPLEGAEVLVRETFVNQRLAAVPIEANAVVAEPHGEGVRLWVSSQVPFRVRDQVASALCLDESAVHVIAPDVGGAFGAKLMTYEEQVVLAALAHKLGRPVRWIEYRTENMVAMTHGRAQRQTVALAASRDGRLVGMEADIVADSGAYAGLGATLPAYTALISSGAYSIPKMLVRTRSVFTNTTVTSAYRGAGRPEATSMVERAMDLLACELQIDPAELRRKNLITSFPHTTAVGATYDSGDYVRTLDLALKAAGYAELRREQAARRARGDRLQLGVGVCCYVEMTAVQQTSEVASARAEADGTIVVSVGTTSSGQGHETAYAQLTAQLLGVRMDDVRVVQSDTATVTAGGGTYGSRTLQLGGSAVRAACVSLIEKARLEAARRLEAGVDDIERMDGGRFGVKGVPGSALTWAQLASEAVVVAEEEFEQDGQTYPFGCHIAVAEVDVETGEARLTRHIAVDDCGTVLNPMLVEGQIHGGVLQGVAQALYEEFVYDPDGNPLTTSLVDYSIPTIGEMPPMETLHTETPTPLNPLGAKGVGESGTIGATAAVQNAVIDAVSHLGVRHIDMPLHPMRVWQAIQAARSPAAEA